LTCKRHCANFMALMCWIVVIALSVYAIARFDASVRDLYTINNMAKASCTVYEAHLEPFKCTGWCLVPLTRRDERMGREVSDDESSSHCLEREYECYRVRFLVGFSSDELNINSDGNNVTVNASTMLPSDSALQWWQECHKCYKSDKAAEVKNQYLSGSPRQFDCYFKRSDPSGSVTLVTTEHRQIRTIFTSAILFCILWCCCAGVCFYCCPEHFRNWEPEPNSANTSGDVSQKCLDKCCFPVITSTDVTLEVQQIDANNVVLCGFESCSRSRHT